jgi:predicted DNA-binding transcriptional regulator AlpA
MAHRPPSYCSKATLARELDVSESTVDEWVRRGILPRPLKTETGIVRFRWETVDAALASRLPSSDAAPADPFMKGLANVSSPEDRG